MARWTAAADEVRPPAPDPDDRPRRRWGGRKVGFVLVLLALVYLAYAVVRIFAIESDWYLIAAATVTPYVAAGGVVLSLVILLFGRRAVAVAVLVMAFALGTLLLPRYLSNSQPTADGERLRIMTANLWLGQADPDAVVDLVRAQRIDVLVLPELTPAAASALDDAGLATVLSHRVLDARVGGDGAGILANMPLRQIVLIEESTLSQPSVVVDVPGEDDVELVAVHIQPPTVAESVRAWQDELAGLPSPTPRERVRVLAGDFNATWDHASFRALADRGYADAAEEMGQGLEATWSNWPYGPAITIDHVLADRRCAIAAYDVFDLPGSDHSAIMTELILP